MEIKETIIASIATLVAGWLIGRRKTKADAVLAEVGAVEKATAIWRTLAQDLKKEVDDLRKVVEELKLENIKLQGEIRQLKKQRV